MTPPPLPVGEGEGYNLGDVLDPPVASFVGNRGLQTWNAYGIQNVPCLGHLWRGGARKAGRGAEQSLRRLYFFTQACLSRAWFKYPIEVRTPVPGLVKVSKARHAEWHEHAPIVGCCTSFYCCEHK